MWNRAEWGFFSGRDKFTRDQQAATVHAAIFTLFAQYSIVAAHGQLMLLALTAVGKGVAAHGCDLKLVSTPCRNA